MTATTDPRVDVATAPFLRGLRIAIVIIGAAVLIPSGLVRNLSVYQPLVVQLAGWTALVLIVVTDGVLLVRRRSWGKLRWFALALAYAASLAALLSIPPALATTSANWVFGALGWSGLILLFDLPIAWLATFLAVHEATVIHIALVLPRAGLPEVFNIVVGSLGAIGFPLATGLATAALRRVAEQAAHAAADATRIRADESFAVQVHHARQQRFTGLYDTAVPLLQGLAEGTADPRDASVQRSCAIEAARMRRLFAETDDAPDPLLHELRHAADIAERRGVLVEFETRGRWDDPPLAVRRAMTDVALSALASAESRARVTVLAAGALLVVSVAADGMAHQDMSPGVHTGVDAHVLRHPDTDLTFVEARWTRPTSPPSSSTTTSLSETE